MKIKYKQVNTKTLRTLKENTPTSRGGAPLRVSVHLHIRSLLLKVLYMHYNFTTWPTPGASTGNRLVSREDCQL